ncbi:MAG TPA: hypothetical protein VGQ59_11240 [Cyclobacteriaceae bacterium]|jgi:hypothetical protein|nr:hypothetical protein [Cyclobacteriaceae bacterium]
MKKFLRNCLLWLSFLFAISCHKNEEAPTATVTLLKSDSYPSYLSYWAIISDQSGKVLAWKSLPASVSTSLTFPNKDSVNLTIIKKYAGSGNSSDYYDLVTYENVAPGSYSSPAPVQEPTILGTYKVQFPSPNDYSNFRVDSDCNSTRNTDNTEYTVNVCANSSLFISISKTNVSIPRYLYMPMISVNGSVAIDQTMFNSLPEMKSKTISLGDSYTGAFTYVYGIKEGSSYEIGISSSSSSTPNSLPIFYPDQIGSALDYLLVSVLSKPNINIVYGSTVKDITSYTISVFTPTLDGVTSATPSRLDYNLSGSADYVVTYFNSSNATWNMYSSFSKKVSTVLPIFPDDLKKEIDFSFVSTLKLQFISIGETDLGGYTSYYTNEILGEKKRANNTKSKQYTPKTDGSIGGGG